MAFERDSKKIVIAGASSLLGAELKSLLEESKFAGWDLHLVDEEAAAGTLTEAGGEPAVIRPVEEDSFQSARIVFFTGSTDFSRMYIGGLQATGAKAFDLSGGMVGLTGAHALFPKFIDLSKGIIEQEGSQAWFPKLDAMLAREFSKDAVRFLIPSAAATAAAGLALALAKAGVQKLAVTCFQSVSEAGRVGIEELESQTGQLLSFQSVGQPVFDTQVAFNLLDRYGPASRQKLGKIRERVRRETEACLGGKVAMPAIQVVHAPVFYGTVFSACAEFAGAVDGDQIVSACKDAGFAMSAPGEAGPSNVSAAGEKAIQLGNPEKDPSLPGTWWFWGAADNIRLPAANAVKLAEMVS
jgi:aspartate-semialdehyde dehydrogenase